MPFFDTLFVLFIRYFQLNQTIEAVKEELAKEKNLSDKSQKDLETDLVSTKHRWTQESPDIFWMLVGFDDSYCVLRFPGQCRPLFSIS